MMSSASMVTQMWSVNSVTMLHSTLGLLLESETETNVRSHVPLGPNQSRAHHTLLPVRDGSSESCT